MTPIRGVEKRSESSFAVSNVLDEFYKFEKYADASVAELSIWKLPIRSILSSLYLSADAKFVGGRFNRKMPRDADVGTAMISRLSYLSSYFGKSPTDIGAHIDDALSVVDVAVARDFEQLLGYAHFCEIVPLVRNGFFTVESRESGFHLRHPNVDFIRHEENDILMSEIVLPHDLVRPPYPIEHCIEMVKSWPRIAGETLTGVLKPAFDHYVDNIFELPLLSDAAFVESFGFARQDFIRMRAALMGYADFCLGMADAAELLSARAFPSYRRKRLQREVREWTAPLLNRNHIVGVAAGVSGVDPAVAEKIVNLFTIVISDLKNSGGGDGFFPPFFRLGGSLLFSPHAVKFMMPERNLLYRTARTDQRTFDNVVSGSLEPSLLQDAVECFSDMPNVVVRPEVNWRNGEIDLLVYHAPTNTALQIQAKAAIPPQGARMVARVESRSLEAAEQIKRFLDLSEKERDAICSAAIGKKVEGVSWTSAVMTRTCLGTEKAWSANAGCVPLNPVMLKAAVKRMVHDKVPLSEIGNVVGEELKELRANAVRGWQDKSFKLFGQMIELPLLHLNYEAIAEFRKTALPQD
ncbi:hypothetical protein HFO81_07200 [Rhizobium leguminosarum]|uniref:hypothetical protein n=1 Tax=Rhizobium leguminosarum TaxID=384 RepID=UPI001C95D06B|nr:hypothetical protein [Rhizobium leguminosarum]MBY5505331.1 hypothetical protein [Rhizobium leguminosarum]